MVRPFAIPALALVVFVLAAGSGLLAMKLEARFVEAALGGIGLFLLTLCGPEFVILALLVVASTLFNDTSFPHLFGFSIVELGVFFLLGLVLINYLSGKKGFVHTPLDWPVFLFVAIAIISFLNAKYNLGTISQFRNSVMRTILVYLLFFAVTNLIKTRRQLMTLIRGMMIIATITAGFMIVQQAAGSTIRVLPGQTLRRATALGQDLGGVSRLSSSGAVIICWMLFPALILQVMPAYMRGRKWLSAIPILFFPPAIAFTFDRNLWIGVAMAGIVLVLISRIENSSRIILLLLVFAVVSFSLAFLLDAYFPRIGTMFNALYMRFMSLFAGDELIYDSSTQWRLLENEYAIASIRKYPLLGVGPKAAYRPYVEFLGGDLLSHYVHNAYLWLLVDFGILGFLPFLWFSIAFLVRGISARRSLEDVILRGFVLGFTIGYIVLLTSSIAAPRFLGMHSVVPIAIIMGMNEVMMRLER
jgi:hypothetical protein